MSRFVFEKVETIDKHAHARLEADASGAIDEVPDFNNGGVSGGRRVQMICLVGTIESWIVLLEL